MNKRKGTTARLTDQAHILLAEKAGYSGDSMKKIASEAIFLMFSKEKLQEDCMPLLKEEKDINEEYRISLDSAYKKIQDNKHVVFRAFVLGTVVGGLLLFFVGVLW